VDPVLGYPQAPRRRSRPWRDAYAIRDAYHRHTYRHTHHRDTHGHTHHHDVHGYGYSYSYSYAHDYGIRHGDGDAVNQSQRHAVHYAHGDNQPHRYAESHDHHDHNRGHRDDQPELGGLRRHRRGGLVHQCRLGLDGTGADLWRYRHPFQLLGWS
jgi:hypothetical protein